MFHNPSSSAPSQSFGSSSDQQNKQEDSRRRLAPLATSNTETHSSTGSPHIAGYSALASSSGRFGPRRTPPSFANSGSPAPGLQPGGHQSSNHFPSRSITSPRSRTITPSQQSAGGYQFPGPGAGGGGGGFGSNTRSGAYSPSLTGPGVSSPTGYNYERSSSISSNPSSATGTGSSFAKISATQVLLLVDTISEKKGKADWEAKAEKIRKVSLTGK